MPGFQSTRLATEGALEPFFFLYTDDSIQGNPETCKQSNEMLNYEVKNTLGSALVPWIFEYSNSPSGVSGSYSKHSGKYPTDAAASEAQNLCDIFR